MSYIRSVKYLQTSGGTKYPATMADIGGGRSDALFNNTLVSHTASIPLNKEIKNDDTLTDHKGYQYRVIEHESILGKMRLRLERL